MSPALVTNEPRTSPHTADRAELRQHTSCISRTAMAEHETTSRMQRAEFLGLLHELLEHDLVTAKVRAPTLAKLVEPEPDIAELDRETAIIATPKRNFALVMTVSFLAAFIAGFALTTLAI